MALRSLSPRIVAMDELGAWEEGETFRRLQPTGVAIWATMHASGYTPVKQALATLGLENCFDRYILISRKKGPGTREAVFDNAGNTLWRNDACCPKRLYML